MAFNGNLRRDLHEYYGGAMMTPVGHPPPWTKVQAPVSLGHETARTNVALGPGIEGLGEGNLVAIGPIVSCWRLP